MFVLFLVGNRKPFIDIEIDFDQELIYVFNRLKVYTFEDVKLISYNKRHRQIRIFLKRRLLGFSLATIQNKNDISITIEQAMTIGKYGYEVAPKRLYNYHLLLSLVFTGLFVFYAFVISYQEFVWFKKWYIHSYYMLGATVLCIGIAVLLNQTRMKKIYQEQLNTTESTSGD